MTSTPSITIAIDQSPTPLGANLEGDRRTPIEGTPNTTHPMRQHVSHAQLPYASGKNTLIILSVRSLSRLSREPEPKSTSKARNAEVLAVDVSVAVDEDVGLIVDSTSISCSINGAFVAHEEVSRG